LNKIKEDPTPVDKKKAKRFISHVERSVYDSDESVTNFYEAVINFHGSLPVEFFYFGNLDEEGLFHGQAILKVTTFQSCYKGRCKENPFGQIVGTFEHGLLQGPVVTYSPKRDRPMYFILKDGVIHSLVISIGMKPIYPLVEIPKYAIMDKIKALPEIGLGYLGLFRNGKAVGDAWYGLVGEDVIGQGFLYGHPDKKGSLTGDNIAFIYPDHLTALVGRFEDKFMKSAKEARITQVTCQDGLIQARFSQPVENSAIFYYDPPNNESMASPALMTVRDPLEKRTVEVYESLLPNSGEGLFAVRDIPQGQVRIFYFLNYYYCVYTFLHII